MDNPRPQAGDRVRFRVLYVDRDNDAPADLRVVVTRPDGTEVVREMRAVDDTDTDYSDGVAFAAACGMRAVGRHGYRYEGSDARGATLQGDLTRARRLLVTEADAGDQ